MIGSLSVLYIYPLNIESVGLAQTIINFGLFLSPFIGFSTNSLVIKFFDRNSKEPNSILIVTLFISLIYVILFMTLYYVVILPNLDSLSFLGYNPEIFKNNSSFIIAIGICIVFITILNNQSNNLHRAVIPNLFYNVGLKIFMPILILGSYFKLLGKQQIPIGILLFYICLLIVMIFYVKKLKGLPQKIDLTSLNNFNFRQIFSYSIITGLTGLASIFATKIDIISIAGLKGLAEVGKYSLPFFIASLIEIPMGGIASISSPLIANHLNHNEYLELSILLKKASNALFLIGSLIFVLLYAIFVDLTFLSRKPEVFESGLEIFVVIGIAKMIDMATSLNSQTLNYSQYYAYNLYFVIITAIANLFFTIYFTKYYGIVGTSYAILFSIVLYNALKSIILKIKLNLNPFSKSTFLILLILILQIVLVNLLKINFNPLINIVIKSIVVVFSFIFLTWIFKPSDDIDDLIFGSKGIFKNGLNLKKIIGL